jgi:hypothetical protein
MQLPVTQVYFDSGYYMLIPGEHVFDTIADQLAKGRPWVRLTDSAGHTHVIRADRIAHYVDAEHVSSEYETEIEGQ